RHEALGGTGRLTLGERSPTDEIALAEPHETLEPGLEGIVIRGDVLLPRDVALLESQGVHRIHAEIGDAMVASGIAERIVDSGEIIHADMQLPAEFADIA